MHPPSRPVGGRGVPGVVGTRVGGWVGYTGYPAGTLLDPYLVIFKAKGPTYGQKKAILEVSMRFL